MADKKYISKTEFNNTINFLKKEIKNIKEKNQENTENIKKLGKALSANNRKNQNKLDKIIMMLNEKNNQNEKEQKNNNIESDEEKSNSEDENKKEIKIISKMKRAKSNKFKIKNKYNKNIEKLRYLEIKENNNLYKYSLTKVYYPKNTIYYICSDTSCKGRIKVEYDNDINKNTNNECDVKNYTTTKNHSLEINEHNYYINYSIREDLEKMSIMHIKNKMQNIDYLINIIKEEGKKNKLLDSNGEILYNYIINKYNNIQIDYKKIKENNKFFKKEIMKYKENNNKIHLEQSDLKKIINVKLICSKINGYLVYYLNKNKDFKEQLLNISIENENISHEETVEFTRKRKKYFKSIIFYMTDNMKKNLSNSEDINQWFMDTTYYAIPRRNNSYKLLLILGFNIKENLTIIGSIILIKNENIETFSKIFEYLITKYRFSPKIINVDCNKAQIIAIKKYFKESKIIICYYHIIKKLIQHLPEIKSKNPETKKKAKNLLTNIKILLFISREKVKKFFDLIRNNYKATFPKFIKYFHMNFFKKYPLKYLDWNYDIKNTLDAVDINHYFFTNNICESTNRTLNNNYKGVCKTLLSFESAINLLK